LVEALAPPNKRAWEPQPFRGILQPGRGAWVVADEGVVVMVLDDGAVSGDVLAILRCPACMRDYRDETERAKRGKLALIDGAWLACGDCGRRYPIVAGIPHMVVEEAQPGA